jgi:hypothetical protein
MYLKGVFELNSKHIREETESEKSDIVFTITHLTPIRLDYDYVTIGLRFGRLFYFRSNQSILRLILI